LIEKTDARPRNIRERTTESTEEEEYTERKREDTDTEEEKTRKLVL
jgi:hypothetical protein